MEQLPKPLLEAKIQELIEKEYPTQETGDVDFNGVVYEYRHFENAAAKKYAKLAIELAIEHLQKDAMDVAEWCTVNEYSYYWLTGVWVGADNTHYTREQLYELYQQSMLPAPPITTKP